MQSEFQNRPRIRVLSHPNVKSAKLVTQVEYEEAPKR